MSVNTHLKYSSRGVGQPSFSHIQEIMRNATNSHLTLTFPGMTATLLCKESKSNTTVVMHIIFLWGEEFLQSSSLHCIRKVHKNKSKWSFQSLRTVIAKDT